MVTPVADAVIASVCFVDRSSVEIDASVVLEGDWFGRKGQWTTVAVVIDHCTCLLFGNAARPRRNCRCFGYY